MSILLALDLATTTGFSYWKPGMARPKYGVWNLPENVKDETELVTLALRRKLHDYHALESFQDGTIIIERNIKKPTDKLRTIEILTGLVMEAATTARFFGAVPRVVDNGDMVKWWCGDRHLQREDRKKYSLMAAQSRGWKPSTHDAADALGLLTYYAGYWNVEVPWDTRACPGPAYLDLKAKGVVVG